MQRKGFALLTALFILTILITLGVSLLDFSGIYKELLLKDYYFSQAKFYEKSAINIVNKKDLNNTNFLSIDFKDFKSDIEILKENNKTILKIKTYHKKENISCSKTIIR